MRLKELGMKVAYGDHDKTRNSPRHFFLFEIGGVVKRIPVKVKPARKSVTLLLTEAHVRQSMEERGFGNAQKCAGAICAKDPSVQFPHKFTGYVDWLYRRCYVSSRNNPVHNLPVECYAYSHGDPVAKLFDEKGGAQKILKIIQERGPISIELFPPVYQVRVAGRPAGDRTIKYDRSKGVGHKARIARVKLGGLI